MTSLASDIPATVLGAVHSAATEAVLFYLFAALVAASSLAVVASRNVVRMSVALLLALAGVAGLFFLLNAEFLAAVQLVVYVGGTLILIVFGVMLTSTSRFARFHPTKPEVAVAVVLAVVLVTTLVLARPADEARVPVPATAVPSFLANGQVVDRVRYDAATGTLRTDRALPPATRDALADRGEAEFRPDRPAERHAFDMALYELSHAARGLPAKRPADPDAPYPVAALGVALLGDYLLPFELASVLLLAVMIGAAYLAKARRRGEVDESGRRPVDERPADGRLADPR